MAGGLAVAHGGDLVAAGPAAKVGAVGAGARVVGGGEVVC